MSEEKASPKGVKKASKKWLIRTRCLGFLVQVGDSVTKEQLAYLDKTYDDYSNYAK